VAPAGAPDEVQALAPIASGALSLIAFAVGSELTAEVLRGERRRTVGRIVPAPSRFRSPP